MMCSGCKKEMEDNIPIGVFLIERDAHNVTYNVCKTCALQIEHYILWRLE